MNESRKLLKEEIRRNLEALADMSPDSEDYKNLWVITKDMQAQLDNMKTKSDFWLKVLGVGVTIVAPVATGVVTLVTNRRNAALDLELQERAMQFEKDGTVVPSGKSIWKQRH